MNIHDGGDRDKISFRGRIRKFSISNDNPDAYPRARKLDSPVPAFPKCGRRRAPWNVYYKILSPRFRVRGSRAHALNVYGDVTGRVCVIATRRGTMRSAPVPDPVARAIFCLSLSLLSLSIMFPPSRFQFLFPLALFGTMTRYKALLIFFRLIEW